MCALPENLLPQDWKLIEIRRECDEVVARQLPQLAGKMDASVSQQNLAFTDASRIENHLTRSRIAGVVLPREVKMVVPQGNP